MDEWTLLGKGNYLFWKANNLHVYVVGSLCLHDSL